MNKLVGLLVLALLAGCMGSGVKSRMKSLDVSITAYAEALRWGRYDDAQKFHLTRDGVRIALDEHAMKDIRVTEYSVRETKMDDDGEAADVQAEFKYFIANRGALQTKVEPQIWWHDKESKRWLLDSGLPDFTGNDGKEPRIKIVPR